MTSFQVKALYDYTAEVDGDLSFKEGDMIDVTESVDDWWTGSLSNGDSIGTFPSNFVEKILLPAPQSSIQTIYNNSKSSSYVSPPLPSTTSTASTTTNSSNRNSTTFTDLPLEISTSYDVSNMNSFESANVNSVGLCSPFSSSSSSTKTYLNSYGNPSSVQFTREGLIAPKLARYSLSIARGSSVGTSSSSNKKLNIIVAKDIQVVAVEERENDEGVSNIAPPSICYYTIRIIASNALEFVEELLYEDFVMLKSLLKTKYPGIELMESLPRADVSGRTDLMGLRKYLSSFLFIKNLAILLIQWFNSITSTSSRDKLDNITTSFDSMITTDLIVDDVVPEVVGDSPIQYSRPVARSVDIGATRSNINISSSSHVKGGLESTTDSLLASFAAMEGSPRPSSNGYKSTLLSNNSNRNDYNNPSRQTTPNPDASKDIINCRPISAASQPPHPKSHDFSMDSLDAFDELMDRGFTVEVRKDIHILVSSSSSSSSGGDDKTLPRSGDTVEVDYRAMIWDGAQTNIMEYEVSNGSVCFTVGAKEVILGLDEAIQHVAVGESVTIVISPDKGYGTKWAKNKTVPPSSHLVYFLQLIRCGLRGDVAGDIQPIKVAHASGNTIGANSSQTSNFINIRGKHAPKIVLEQSKPKSGSNRSNSHCYTSSRPIAATVNKKNTPVPPPKRSSRRSSASDISNIMDNTKTGPTDAFTATDTTSHTITSSIPIPPPKKFKPRKDLLTDNSEKQLSGKSKQPPPVRSFMLRNDSTGIESDKQIFMKSNSISHIPNANQRSPQLNRSVAKRHTLNTVDGSENVTDQLSRMMRDNVHRTPPAANNIKKFKSPAAKVSTGSSSGAQTKVIPLHQLKTMTAMDGIDCSSKEKYLSDAEFLQLFKMNRLEFTALPKWKKTNLKRDNDLF